jgi:hypothetical protein
MMKHYADLDTTVNGIPCGVVVTHFLRVHGNSMADSDWDYRGYTESEWFLVDRKGYKAAWLEKMLDDDDKIRISEEIEEVYA